MNQHDNQGGAHYAQGGVNHTNQNVGRGGGRGGGGRGGGGRGGGGRGGGAGEKSARDQLRDDLQTERPMMWPLSCYAPKGDEPNLLGGDSSFEEVRWVSYTMLRRGQDPRSVSAKVDEFARGKENDIRSILNFPDVQLKRVLDLAAAGTMAPAGLTRVIDCAFAGLASPASPASPAVAVRPPEGALTGGAGAFRGTAFSNRTATATPGGFGGFFAGTGVANSTGRSPFGEGASPPSPFAGNASPIPPGKNMGFDRLGQTPGIAFPAGNPDPSSPFGGAGQAAVPGSFPGSRVAGTSAFWGGAGGGTGARASFGGSPGLVAGASGTAAAQRPDIFGKAAPEGGAPVRARLRILGPRRVSRRAPFRTRRRRERWSRERWFRV